MKCAYCDQKHCKCGANDYASKEDINTVAPPVLLGGGDYFDVGNVHIVPNVGNEDPRKEELLRQIAEKNRKLTISLYIEFFGGALAIAFLVLGLTHVVGVDIAQPVSCVGVFFLLLGLSLASHYDDSE